MGVDRAADQRAADCADHQAGRAVRLAAIKAAVTATPFAILVALATALLLERRRAAAGVEHLGLGRTGRDHHRRGRNRKRNRAEREKNLTHTHLTEQGRTSANR